MAEENPPEDTRKDPSEPLTLDEQTCIEGFTTKHLEEKKAATSEKGEPSETPTIT